MTNESSWVNGESASSIPVSDRGLAYGDGVFETIRVVGRMPQLASLHWRRLSDSLNRLKIAIDLDLLVSEVEVFLSRQQQVEGVLKVIVTRGSGGRGYNPVSCMASQRILSFHPFPEHPETNWRSGISLYACETRLGHTTLAGMKHLNRLENVLARSEWSGRDYQEGLMLDMSDKVIEGTMSNVFLIKNGIMYTPALDRCGVSGVCREFILQEASLLGVPFIERDVDESFLLDADEVFVCNSVNGIWPVAQYKHHRWQVGLVTVKVRDHVLAVLNS